MKQQGDHSQMQSNRGGNILQRWFLLTSQRFPPLKYIFYSCLFVGAIQMSDQDTPLSLSLADNARSAVGIFLLLWFMRIVDEIKDLEHDREFHPLRPLASEEVSVGDALQLTIVIGVLIAVDAFIQSWTMGWLALTVMSYSLVLWGVERVWRWFRECMTVNILFAIQLKTLLVFYVSAGLPANNTQRIPISNLAIAIVCCYLHWEILRKTEPKPTKDKAYSNEIGMWSCLTLGLLLLAIAVSLMIASLGPRVSSLSLFLIVALPSLIGVVGFARHQFGKRLLSILSLIGYLLFLSVLTWFHKIAELLDN